MQERDTRQNVHFILQVIDQKVKQGAERLLSLFALQPYEAVMELNTFLQFIELF